MIKRIWDFLFYSCRHQYEIIEKRDKIITTHYEWNSDREKLLIIVSRCKHCGKIKSTTIS